MLANLIGPATQLLDKFIEDKDQKAALAHEISTMAERHAQELAKGQIEVNKMEAASSSMFVAGWRPAVGWICALGFASNFILIPMANFALALASIDVQIPMIDTTQMMPVLMGMLGLGTLRTVEKVRKVSREQ
jgi:phenylpyruvate tautomerase PptA (4-oxalocrotonate tautomerase family)|tara:strand:- start:57 stop:455 length:399 start_codon:yes stop_codon:yes gene_type:complete